LKSEKNGPMTTKEEGPEVHCPVKESVEGKLAARSGKKLHVVGKRLPAGGIKKRGVGSWKKMRNEDDEGRGRKGQPLGWVLEGTEDWWKNSHSESGGY